MSKYFGFPYTGGKKTLLKTLLPIISYCNSEYNLNTLIDACTGGGSVISNVNPFEFRSLIANDLDPGLYSLYKVLQDAEQTKLLILEIDRLIKTKFQRKQFDAFRGELKPSINDSDKWRKDLLEKYDSVKLAARTCFLIYSSHRSNMHSFISDNTILNFKDKAVHLRLTDYNAIYRGIDVTNKDLFDYLKDYGHREDALIFLDVPYADEATRSADPYRVKNGEDFQKRLVNELMTLAESEESAKFILCGYDNTTYTDLTRKSLFYKTFVGTVVVRSAVRKDKDGYTVKPLANEYIWSNMEIPTKYQAKKTAEYNEAKKQQNAIKNGSLVESFREDEDDDFEDEDTDGCDNITDKVGKESADA